jgi:hypothetical protein
LIAGVLVLIESSVGFVIHGPDRLDAVKAEEDDEDTGPCIRLISISGVVFVLLLPGFVRVNGNVLNGLKSVDGMVDEEENDEGTTTVVPSHISFGLSLSVDKRDWERELLFEVLVVVTVLLFNVFIANTLSGRGAVSEKGELNVPLLLLRSGFNGDDEAGYDDDDEDEANRDDGTG